MDVGRFLVEAHLREGRPVGELAEVQLREHAVDRRVVRGPHHRRHQRGWG